MSHIDPSFLFSHFQTPQYMSICTTESIFGSEISDIPVSEQGCAGRCQWCLGLEPVGESCRDMACEYGLYRWVEYMALGSRRSAGAAVGLGDPELGVVEGGGVIWGRCGGGGGPNSPGGRPGSGCPHGLEAVGWLHVGIARGYTCCAAPPSSIACKSPGEYRPQSCKWARAFSIIAAENNEPLLFSESIGSAPPGYSLNDERKKCCSMNKLSIGSLQ